MAKQFKTWFGIPVPPWRDRKLGSGQCTIRFVIKGPIPSKKNSQQAISRRKEALEFLDNLKRPPTMEEAKRAVRMVTAKMMANVRYMKFLEDQRPAIEKQREFWMKQLGEKGLIFPIQKASMSIRFYFAHRHRQDSVNKQQSVQDLLKDLKVIVDDDYTCLNPIMLDADCYHEEILSNIVVVTLSFRLNR